MIVCNYCQQEIVETGDPADRRIAAGISRPPEPPPPSIDLHARCVDPWVTEAQKIHQPE